VDEVSYNKDARILAFQKPAGKRSIVVSNRTGAPRPFLIETGIAHATWKGYRYTPQEAGEGTMGIPVGLQTSERLSLTVPHLTWEFWEEQ
jgi:hypothetical protein